MGKTAQRRAKALSGAPRVSSTTAVEPTPTAPPAIPYLSGSATETAVDALIDDPNNWRESAATGTLTYGTRAGVFVSIGDPTKPPTVNAEEAWKLVITLGGDEAAQTLLYVMAKCLSNDNPLDKVRISVQEALTFRGLKRHRSRDFRADQKRTEARRFRMLSEIWVTAKDTIQVPSGRGFRSKNINVTSRLIEVAIESEDDEEERRGGGRMRLPSIVDAASSDIPYAVRAGLGEWAKPYADTPQMMKHVLLTAMQYDVNKDCERFAMRLSLAIMFNRVNSRTTIRELLDAARLSVPKYHLDAFKDNLEEAFSLLYRDGVTGECRYSEQYPELPRTRWLQKWLAWHVDIPPPPKRIG